MNGVPPAAAHDAPRRVLKNAAWLAGGQFLAAPLALLVNSSAARFLGPDNFAWLYLATTFTAFGFLVVEWGQSATLTATIARERDLALDWLASSLTVRATLILPVVLCLALVFLSLGHPITLLGVLALSVLAACFTTVATACQDLFRALERADLSAASYLAAQLLAVLVLVPVLWLGGGLHGFLLGQAGCAAFGATVLLVAVRRVAHGQLAPRCGRMRTLFLEGRPFLVFNLVLALQVNIDALFLSRLAPSTVLGWSAVASKLVGVLVFPASALIGSLYPTLCRLKSEAPDQMAATVRSAIRLVLICLVPLALGCGLFPDLGVAIYGGEAYRPAETNLRILSVYLLLVYLTMPLGTTLIALGRQRAWTAAQLGCVLVSVVLDPWLIPWFQTRTGNGGLGVCVATGVSECLMLLAALRLLPIQLFDPAMGRTLARVGMAAAALAAMSLARPWLGAWGAAIMSGIAYFAILLALGELPWQQLVRRFLRRHP